MSLLDQLRVRAAARHDDSNSSDDGKKFFPLLAEIGKDTTGQETLESFNSGRGNTVYENDYRTHKARIALKKMQALQVIVGGGTIHDAARTIGVSVQTVRLYLKDPGVMDTLKQLSQEIYEKTYSEVIEHQRSVKERVIELADQALDEMERLLQEAADPIRAKVAMDILDRHGDVPKVSKSENRTAVVHVDAETLIAAAMAAEEVMAPRKVTKGSIEPEHWDREGNQQP